MEYKMYCDYCTCSDCKFGTKHISHAKTFDGKWICDICYLYDLCTANQRGIGPCENKLCEHRPKLISKFE